MNADAKWMRAEMNFKIDLKRVRVTSGNHLMGLLDRKLDSAEVKEIERKISTIYPRFRLRCYLLSVHYFSHSQATRLALFANKNRQLTLDIQLLLGSPTIARSPSGFHSEHPTC
jgi:hypothetical protein